MKKRYISPVTNVVQAFEPESSILYDSYMTKSVYVDELHNMNADQAYKDASGETFLIEF